MKNIKKNIAVVWMMCNMFFVMTGCENKIPEMTEAQNALVTEYAAGLLLKYHADYDGRLVDTSVAPEIPPVVEMPAEEIVSDNSTEEEVTVSGSTIPSDEVGETVKSTLTIAQVLGADGFEVNYRTFEVCDNYPDTESSPEELFFAMKAGQGNKLLVVILDITNTGTQEAVFDTLSMTELDCKVLINESDTQRAYVSMLENDFMAISRTFGGGEVYEAAIITEMPEEKAAQVTSVGLQLKNGERETTVKSAE